MTKKFGDRPEASKGTDCIRAFERPNLLEADVGQLTIRVGVEDDM
jgi:hypothetical protein